MRENFEFLRKWYTTKLFFCRVVVDLSNGEWKVLVHNKFENAQSARHSQSDVNGRYKCTPRQMSLKA